MSRIAIFAALCLLLMPLARAQSLKPGQRLRFICPSEPLLDISRTITPDGAVILPFLGPVGAAGKSLERVEAAVEEGLRSLGRYCRIRIALTMDPKAPISFRGAVDLAGSVPATPAKTLRDILAVAHPNQTADLAHIRLVDAYGKSLVVDANASGETLLRPGDEIEVPIAEVAYQVTILGGVVNPGSVPMKEGMTISQAIDAVGGVSGHGDTHQITLERNGVTSPATLESLLLRGDIVRVGLTLDRKFVAVKGAVARQGVVEWRKGMLLTEVIKEAGGETAAADLAHIQVRRFDGGKIVVFDLAKIRSGAAANPTIEANDTVIVFAGGRS